MQYCREGTSLVKRAVPNNNKDATDKLKMSDSSSIHTIEEISHHYVSSRDASAIRSISDSKATEDITPRSSYETDSWETTTKSSRGSSFVDSRRTLESFSDDDDYSGRQRRWRRSAGEERTSSSGTERSSSSYYSTHWDASGSQTDSEAYHEASDKVLSIQQHFIKSRLKHLKTTLHKPKTDDDKKMQQETPPRSEDRGVFCQNLISILERKKTTNLDSRRRNQTFQKTSKDDKKILIDREIVNRLKIENLLSAMKRASSSRTTDALESCQQCRLSQEAVLKRTFVRNKTSKLGNELTDQKVDLEISTKDPLTAIGDLARSLPKPSDNPEEIWAKLLNQGIT
ncbi:uncharacterized protein LOC117305676 isoform X2 [Asterias rubens]|uniref:uncharacterized protein LOC117305676 isoform X2 n=1 Tax=Asterias rubens TaxID=7604 RepID=UPI00145537EC|nr:uncharacterized protein LOC117305676 isoform X2 [Asterias rubens]